MKQSDSPNYCQKVYDCWCQNKDETQRKKAERIVYLLGEIKNYEDLVLVMSHVLSDEGWSWFYEPEMFEGNDGLIKHMGTIEGIRAIMSLFGISEHLSDLIVRCYGDPYRRKSSDDLVLSYLIEQRVPWSCCEVISLIRKPASLKQVEDEIRNICRYISDVEL